MAEPYTINITDKAARDLSGFSRYIQRMLRDGIEVHLRHQPMWGTRRIKAL